MAKRIVKHKDNHTGYWYVSKDYTSLSLTELIQILQKIKDNEGDINLWTWSDGIAKTIKHIEVQHLKDGRNVAILGL